jgi:uncharacterized protein YaeQ
MAQNATIYKAELQVSDLDRHYYQSHTLTLARHPSETDERLMVRLLVFALHANEALAFTKGLSEQDEPDLWQKDLTGAIDLWIDVGQPDEKRLRKACSRARQVLIYNYSGRSADVWWQQNQGQIERARNLTVRNVPAAAATALAALAQRTMRLQCTIQDGQVWLADGERAVEVDISSRTPRAG